MQKTNALRILDSNKIKYTITEYDTADGKIDGISVANKVGKDVNRVFKTLVACFQNELFVFVIPVNKELDLKSAAKAAGKKSIDMLPQKNLLPMTGYIHGGCTAIGMKKSYPVFLDERALNGDELTVSAGKVGMQITLAVKDYIRITLAQTGHYVKEN